MVLIAQAVLGICALLLGFLVLADAIDMWMVYTIVLVSGTATAFENPACRSFLGELVSRDDVANAEPRNSSVASAARAGGPALAGSGDRRIRRGPGVHRQWLFPTWPAWVRWSP